MLTRHFHATSLVVVGIILLLALSFILKQKPTLPVTTSQTITTIATPSQSPQQQFLYYDHNDVYDSFFVYSLGTNAKQGIYGTTDKSDIYTSFSLLNQQLYMNAQKKAGILNLHSHFFYGINMESVPLTIAPSQKKAIYITYLKPSTKTKNTNQTTELKAISTSPNKETLIPVDTQLVSTLQPLCWSQDENDILFTTPSAIYMLSLDKRSIIPLKFSTDVLYYSKIYCNSQTNMIYFNTPNGFYEQKFVAIKPTKVNISKTESPYVFSSSNTTNEALMIDKNILKMINLGTGQQKTLYTATVSATITPYFWKGDNVLFTEQSNALINGIYYLVGRNLNLHTQVMTTFEKHEAENIDSLGSIIPVGWVDQ